MERKVRLTELRARLEDLRESDRTEVLVAPTAEVMRNVKEILFDAMLNRTPGQRKALLKELVVEVRVETREASSQPSGFPLRRFALWIGWWTQAYRGRTN